MSRRHPLFARAYVRLSRGAADAGQDEHRRELLAGLRGTVLEVGAGHGLNFPLYPSEVTRVVAVEPEPYLRALASDAARTAPVPVDVVDGVAERLPMPDASVDAVVFSLVLCSVPDQRVALEEARRVLRADGEIRFYEHVRSRSGLLAAVQRASDVWWPYVAGGCHTSRDTVATIEDAGFRVQAARGFPFTLSPVALPARPHVIGTARPR